MCAAPDNPPRAERPTWYDDGLRFECTMCGNCCTGPPGYVWFDRAEGAAMAQQLGMQPKQFRARYARRVRGHWSLNEVETEHGYDCVFLDRTSQPGKALCRVYRARPLQCRTWPFWPDMLRSESSWQRVKRHTPCPGMDHGRLYPVEEIRIIRDSMERVDNAES